MRGRRIAHLRSRYGLSNQRAAMIAHLVWRDSD